MIPRILAMDTNMTLCCMIIAILIRVQASQSEGQTSTVTLYGGALPEGTVEYTNDGSTWYTICGQHFSNISVVKVVCRQLGFTGANKYIKSSPFGSTNSATPNSFFRCSGNEENLSQCSIDSCSPTTPYEPAAAVCYDGNYLGCFVDDPSNRVLPANNLISNLTVLKCLMHCGESQEYVYAGVENSTECYCGNVEAEYSRLGRVGDEECQNQCEGNQYSSCGGLDRIAIFKIRIPITSATQGTMLSFPSSSATTTTTTTTTATTRITTKTTTKTTKTTTTGTLTPASIKPRTRGQETAAISTKSTDSSILTTSPFPSTSTRIEVESTLMSIAPSTSEETNNIVLYAGIGGGGAFLVILIIIIVIACFCSKQRNMKNTPPDQADDPSVMYALPDRQVRTLNLRRGKPSSYEDNLNVYAISSIDRLEPIGMKTSKDERELYAPPNNNQHSHEIKNGSGTRIDVEGMCALPDKYRMGNDIGNTIMVENDLYCST